MRQRLGATALRVPHADVDPDETRAWAARPMPEAGGAAVVPTLPTECLLPLRPTVRVAPPRAIEVVCDARWRPVQMRLPAGLQPVQAVDGPERVAAAWWRGEQGTHDRWRVLVGGAWWWLRREGAAWWLEGAWT
jgi:hypothetical protein